MTSIDRDGLGDAKPHASRRGGRWSIVGPRVGGLGGARWCLGSHPTLAAALADARAFALFAWFVACDFPPPTYLSGFERR